MAFRALPVLALLVALACSPAEALTPTPTISVYDAYPAAVADLLPQEVYNCSYDREIERWERLSPRERAQQETQVATGNIPERWSVALHTQGLSCWALHASDEHYLTFMRGTGGAVWLLPSWQLCIEDAVGREEGVVATSAFVLTDGDLSAYSDDALRCLPASTG